MREHAPMSAQVAAAAVEDILTRGVGSFIDPDESFKKKLLAKATGDSVADLVVKFGVDPNRPDIHLGHAVVLRKLRQLQELGCKVIFLLGDFTAQIGDPTGKSKVRPEIEQAAVEEDMKTYLDQVGKILLLDKSVFSWIRNSDWFTNITDLSLPDDYKVGMDIVPPGKTEKVHVEFPPNSFLAKSIVFEETRMQKKIAPQTSVVTLRSLLWGLKHVTLAQLIERDMFQKRVHEGESLFLHEMLYPVFQGIDSDVLAQIYGSCDLEVGGTDQTFNMLMGRKIMEINKRPPQAVLSFELLVGLDGKEKMSKSLDNYIGITDAPGAMFGKIMSISDELLLKYFELCTFTPMEEVSRLKKALTDKSAHPRDVKMELAQQVVETYHGKEPARQAREQFVQTFQKRELPEEMPTIKSAPGELLADVFRRAGVVSSKSEFRRLIEEGAIREDGDTKVSDPTAAVKKEAVYKIGKLRFLKVTL